MFNASTPCRWLRAYRYYFVLSLFPLLIVFAAIVAYLPVPNLYYLAPNEIFGSLEGITPGGAGESGRAPTGDLHDRAGLARRPPGCRG